MDRKYVSRRRVLGTLGATGIAGIAGCTGDGGDDGGDGDGGDGGDGDGGGGDGGDGGGAEVSGTVKIGALQPVSGDLRYYGQSSLWGFFLGFDHKAGGGAEFAPEATTGTKTVAVGDVDYEILVRDTQLSAGEAQSLATDLVQNEDVDLLFGCTSSQAAERVAQTVSAQANVPTILGPAASANITSNSDTCSEVVFRASENTAMDARSGGKYVAQETDISQVFLFGADYSFGHAVVENYRTVLEDEGVEIVGERFVPQGYEEWPGLLNNAEEAGAEGIVAGFTVATLPQLFTAYLNGDYSYRIFGGFATEITNSVVGDLLVNQLGEPLTDQKIQQSGLGPFTTRYHWNQYDNGINDAFVEAHTGAYGKVPDLFASGMFTAASSIVQAVEASASTDGADIAAELRGMTVAESPKGEDAYVFQEYNNQARSEMTVANPVPTTDEWSDNWDAAIMPGEPLARISRDETTIPADSQDMDCDL